jgi:hypothetical protein
VKCWEEHRIGKKDFESGDEGFKQRNHSYRSEVGGSCQDDDVQR